MPKIGEGDLLDGRLRLRRWIGSGPYGSVWELVDERAAGRGDGGPKSLLGKQYDRSPRLNDVEYRIRLEGTEREAARGARLIGHPRVCAPRRLVIDESGTPWLASEYVEGIALAEYLHRYGPLPWHRAAQLAADLLEAYEAYVPEALVHRNIKPSNVIMTGGGRAVLTDFAPPIHPLASFSFGPADRGERLRQFEHLAPERLHGHDGPAGDLFAIGGVVYRALHGASPLRRETEADTLRALMDADSPAWPEHAGALTPLLLGLLDPDFATRIDLARAKWLLAWARAAATAQPQDAEPRDAEPRDAGPMNAAPLDARPQDAVPQGVVAAAAGPRDAVPKGLAPRPKHAFTGIIVGGGLTGSGATDCFAFAPDGTELVAATGPAEIHRWELTKEPTRSRLNKLLASPVPRSLRATRRRTAATSLAYGAGGRLLASGGPDNRVRAWRPTQDGAGGAIELGGFDGPVTALAVDPTAVFLAIADRSDVWLWAPVSGAQRALEVPLGHVGALAFAANGGLLAAAGGAKVCLVETWSATAVDIFDTGGAVDCLAFSHDGGMLAAAVPGEGILVYDTATWSVWQNLQCGPGLRVGALAFTRDSHLIATVARPPRFDLYRWRL